MPLNTSWARKNLNTAQIFKQPSHAKLLNLSYTIKIKILENWSYNSSVHSLAACTKEIVVKNVPKMSTTTYLFSIGVKYLQYTDI